MRSKAEAKTKGKTSRKRGGLINVLGPYKGIVAVLILMALAGGAVNLVIPRIIARAIDSFSANSFDLRTVITQFLAAAEGIFVFSLVRRTHGYSTVVHEIISLYLTGGIYPYGTYAIAQLMLPTEASIFSEPNIPFVEVFMCTICPAAILLVAVHTRPI